MDRRPHLDPKLHGWSHVQLKIERKGGVTKNDYPCDPPISVFMCDVLEISR